jgi:hypothetical protein
MGEEPLDKDYVEIVNGKLTGEMLLIKEYALTGPAFINYKFEIRDEVAESLKRRENAFMKRINSVDRPVSQNRSVMRPFMKSRSVLNASGISQTSNRMLPSEMRQRTSQTANANQAEDLGQNIKPISPISGPRPQKEYEKAP